MEFLTCTTSSNHKIEARGSPDDQVVEFYTSMYPIFPSCAIVTQNVDGLHQLSGSSDDQVVELHGSECRAICLNCKKTTPMDVVVDEIIGEKAQPREFR